MMKLNIKLKLVSFALILLVALGSCGTYKELPEAPKVNSEGMLRSELPVESDSNAIKPVEWRQHFQDSYLQTLISEGLTNNIDLQLALKRIEQSEATLMISRAALSPNVMGAAQINHTRLSNGNEGEKFLGYTSNVNSLGVNITWEADIWNKLGNQSKAKYAAFLQTQEYRNLVKTTLVANIANGYYNLLALDEQLRITRETIELLKKSAETMTALKESGQQNAAAVEQSLALLYSTEISVMTLQVAIREQENALSLLIGRIPGPVNRGSLSDERTPDVLVKGFPVAALSFRPDVKQAELAVRQALSITKSAKAAFYPSLVLSTGSFGLTAGTFSGYFAPENLALQLVGGITQPIFNRKQLKGNLKIAQSQQEESLISFRNVMLKAGQEVSNLLYGLNVSLGKNDLRNKQISSLTNAVDYTQQLLLAGEATYTEVLNAQQSLLNAQLSGVKDKLEQLQYSVNLYRALGGGAE